MGLSKNMESPGVDRFAVVGVCWWSSFGKGLREELRNWAIRSRITHGEDGVPQPAASGHQYWIHLLEINDQTRILPLGTAATKIRG